MNTIPPGSIQRRPLAMFFAKGSGLGLVFKMFSVRVGKFIVTWYASIDGIRV